MLRTLLQQKQYEEAMSDEHPLKWKPLNLRVKANFSFSGNDFFSLEVIFPGVEVTLLVSKIHFSCEVKQLFLEVETI